MAVPGVEEERRREALKLAINAGQAHELAEEITSRAQRFYDFLFNPKETK